MWNSSSSRGTTPQTTYVSLPNRSPSADRHLGGDHRWTYSACYPRPFSADAGSTPPQLRTQSCARESAVVQLSTSVYRVGSSCPPHTNSDGKLASRCIGPTHTSHCTAAITRSFDVPILHGLLTFQRLFFPHLSRHILAAHDHHALIVPARNSARPSHGPLPHSRDTREAAWRGGQPLLTMAGSRACRREAQSQCVC